MKRMVDDLFVFTRARLGDTLPVDLTSQDIGRICDDAADEVRASYPDAQIDVHIAGESAGKWDGARLGQLLVNLLVNAVQHGSGKISVSACGDGEQLTLAPADVKSQAHARGRSASPGRPACARQWHRNCT
jgi:signal transduction histidine kinase